MKAQRKTGLFYILLLTCLPEFLFAEVQCPPEKSVTLRSSATTIIDYRKSTVSENPLFNPSQLSGGDTVCLFAATDGRSPGLKIRNFYDVPNLSDQQPITFVNAGGEVVLGDNTSDAPLYIQNSRYLRLSGSGVAGVEYGFRIDGEGVSSQGMKITNRSSDIEVEHWQIGNVKSSGIHLIGVANCADASPPQGISYLHVFDLDGDGSSQRGLLLGYDALGDPIYDPGDPDDVISQSTFTMRNIRIHNNLIHDTGTEGMYLGQNMVDHLYRSDGSRGPAMGSEVICNYTKPDLPSAFQPDVNNINDPLNARIDGIAVFANKLVNTGWDGINVKGGARNCAIYDNQIINHGWLARQSGLSEQANGISTTPNVHCNIYRNTILGGGGSGIFLNGVGGVVTNNLVVDSGTGGESGGAKTTGIEIVVPNSDEWDLSLWYQDFTFGVYNNTVISSLSRGVRLQVPYVSHTMANNVVIATKSPANDSEPGYDIADNVLSQHDYYFDAIDDPTLALSAPDQSDFRPLANSVLIDAGIDMTSVIQPTGIWTLDIEQKTRVMGVSVDVGAYEWPSENGDNGTILPIFSFLLLRR